MEHKSKYIIFFFLAIFFLSFFGYSEASITVGTINPNLNGNFKALLLEDNSVINFGYFATASAYNVTVTDSVLSGYIWGEKLGWVVLNCANTTSGCASTNGNFKVSNNGYGNLSGYAWGQNTGWINFGPFLNSSTSRVKINTDGKFGGTTGADGYAWSQNFGWIKFDCNSSLSCVETDWRPINTRPACNNTLDDDSDGSVDYPTDTGCSSLSDTDESNGAVAVPPPPPPTPPTTNDLTPTSPDTTPTSSTPPTTNDPTPTSPDTTPTSSTGDPFPSPQLPDATSTPINSDKNFYQVVATQMKESFENTVKIVKETREKVKIILENPQVNATEKIVTTGGVIIGSTFSVTSMLFLNPLSFSEIPLIPFRIWSLLMTSFGLKKRTRRWGVVYDSITKQPIDPAYVSLQNLEGSEVASSITDLDGRYGFLVGPGIYRIIANKTNYKFPSGKLAGQAYDELYSNIYWGDYFEVKNENELITKNIPLDPLKFDWNEFAKQDQKRMRFYRKSMVRFGFISNILFTIGFLVALVAYLVAPKPYNVLIMLLYLFIFLLRQTGLKVKAYGSVVEKFTGYPLSFGILRLFQQDGKTEVAHAVINKIGNYYCIVPNGIYNLKIAKKYADGTYRDIFTKEFIKIENGVLDKHFEI